jgi:hypoxanthine phosphoribosyltransferase
MEYLLKNMNTKIEPYITQQDINDRLFYLGRQLTEDYYDKPLIVLVLLKGGMVFASDLIRCIDLPLRVECLSVSSYVGTSSTGEVTINSFNFSDVADSHVLLVDDILDTGLTIKTVVSKILEQSPLSVKTCVLLNKLIPNKRDIEADYNAFNIKNEFVVGYGLDYNEQYRNLPYIGILKQ